MLKSLPVFLMSASLTALAAEGPIRQSLTSVEKGIHLDAWRISAKEVDPKSGADWSIEKSTLRGGKQEGVDIVKVNNGKLSFTVIPTRGMSVLKVQSGDVTLGWDSPVKQVVHPQFMNLQSRGGLGWLEGFNEWLVRCGLEFAGHPGKDKFINNVGDEAEMDLTLHGKIGNIPASEVEVVVDREAPHRIRVRGRVDERSFYGPKLEIWTEISTEPGSTAFRIEDKVTNHGAFDQEVQVIYHSNYGPPLLGKNSKFSGAVKRVMPFNDHAAEDSAHYTVYAGPTKGFIEQVYCIYPQADESGRTLFMLQNAEGNRAVSLAFSVEQLPFFTLWKNTSAVEDGYVTGLQPGTGFPHNRSWERKAGRVPKLAPGASRTMAIDFAIHTDKEAVKKTEARIAKIQGEIKPTVDPKPEKVE